ncbi:hypothetical protein NDQ71_04610 [Pseudoalteromonas sp. KG3]|uniref:hypothetical protein n=1 Tax=Pseudoalteromonas sp. KG3 TaxID=2951137 RepID=UPI002657CC36|nr:hypothetical protein [Pseudoalteromonas sp. KG3]WKD24371.1 hypothetical protein NDQ71_04610 [Pseudoalteromonas sp. KG3]
MFNSKFAWIASIVKPDIAFSLLVGVITLINFPSAIGLYWATSSGKSLLQSLLLHHYFENNIFCGCFNSPKSNWAIEKLKAGVN